MTNLKVEAAASLSINPLDLFKIAKNKGRPLYCSAPMVRYSKLAFRETVAEYGVDLTWTPMILAKEFNRSDLARDSANTPIYFTLSPLSPPTIIQLAVNSPSELARTTSLIAPFVNGIDLNCGCPQSWACSSSLGAALMQQPSLVASLVSTAKATLLSSGYANKTVSVKIRIHRELSQTLAFIRAVEEAGVDFITIHGRMRNTRSSEPVNLAAIKFLTSHARVPVIANGDVFSLADARRIAQETGVQGVMAARGILENPALFDRRFEGEGRCPWEAVEVFLNKVIKQPLPYKLVVHHLIEMAGSDRAQKEGPLLGREERARVMECRSLVELVDLLDEVREVRRLGNVGMC